MPYLSDSADHLFGRATLLIALIYVACAALRLARYTVAASEKHSPDPSVFTEALGIELTPLSQTLSDHVGPGSASLEDS